MPDPDYRHFWGKAQPIDGQGLAWHPLAWHSLDVAAVAKALNGVFPAVAASLAMLCDVDLTEAQTLIIRLAMVHDIGKFSVGFQAKVPELLPDFLGKSANGPPYGDHTAIGCRLLIGELAETVACFAPGVDMDAWRLLAGAVTGHHGRPISPSDQAVTEIGLVSIAAASRFAVEAMTLMGGDIFPGSLGEKKARSFSWQLAGFVNLADWIGSNQSVFHYESPDLSLEQYWREVAIPRAAAALDRAGLRGNDISTATGFAALTVPTEPPRQPSPLQRWAETAELPKNGPSLVLIEDMTGAGKTEAALILAHRMMLGGQGTGIYVALPTMATANAMYQRLAGTYRNLFAAEARPSLALAHGAAHLHDGFQESILDVGRLESSYRDHGDDDVTASAACAAWIASDRSRAFFADVGVGTIDQAFLAVLPVKFAALRLLGLSRRILIVDEAHAYHAYESEELSCLIGFHAAAGGSVIVLSATLPEGIKNRLLKDWRLGRRVLVAPMVWPADYPLVTQVDGQGAVAVTPVAPRTDLPRTVVVERLESEAAAISAIVAAAEAGAAVAWVRNTVDDALAGYAALVAQGVPARLFHARFAMCDRQEIENAVIGTFGAQSTAEDRRGQVLVATQVIEQSLDIDFDLLVTDLAPMDLLIQRAGRLWRHDRENRPLPEPRLLVVSSAPVENAASDWLRRELRGTSFVYADHALMWQTAKVLFAAGALVSPGDVRRLVEAVYGPAALADVPAGLERSRLAAEGIEIADRNGAQINLLKWSKGYSPDNEAWGSETRTPTRLGDERIVFRLALWEDGRLRPWAGQIAPEMPERMVERLWALSEVAVTKRKASGRGSYPAEIERAAAALEKGWNSKGYGAVVLPLFESDNSGYRKASIKIRGGNIIDLTYSSDRGLTFPFRVR